MKNKFSLIILILYTLLLVILNCNIDFINNINLSIASILEVKDPNIFVNVLKLIEIGLFYFGYGICMTIFCIDFFNEFKYMLIYSIVLSIFIVIISVLIKSFYVQLEFLNFIIMLLCVILGVVLQFVIKIKQVKGEDNEK